LTPIFSPGTLEQGSRLPALGDGWLARRAVLCSAGFLWRVRQSVRAWRAAGPGLESAIKGGQAGEADFRRNDFDQLRALS